MRGVIAEMHADDVATTEADVAALPVSFHPGHQQRVPNLVRGCRKPVGFRRAWSVDLAEQSIPRFRALHILPYDKTRHHNRTKFEQRIQTTPNRGILDDLLFDGNGSLRFRWRRRHSMKFTFWGTRTVPCR
jgi:hypothetical protein